MAPKRSKKSDVQENIEKYENLAIEDVLCPICRSILVEPVTLPCSHNFCLACFNGTMENNALVCPLCRIRIGSWLRTVRKEKKIVNQRLWSVIQAKFPEEIKTKLDGEDDIPDENVCIRLSEPGEIRQEYEAELKKQRNEIKKQQEAEELASEIVIRQLLEEENHSNKKVKDGLRKDEEFARRLANDMAEPGCSQMKNKTGAKAYIDKYLVPVDKKQRSPSKRETTKSAKNYTSKVMCQSRRQKVSSNAYKNLLLTKTQQHDRDNGKRSDSGDSIKQEMRYFKPIRTAPKSAPKPNQSGGVRAPLLKVPGIHAMSAWPVTIRAPHLDNAVIIKAHTESAFAPCYVSAPAPAAPSSSAAGAAIPGPSGVATGSSCAAGTRPSTPPLPLLPLPLSMPMPMSVPMSIPMSVPMSVPLSMTMHHDLQAHLQPSTSSDIGRVPKQYYNKKKSAMQSVRPPSTDVSPWFGLPKSDKPCTVVGGSSNDIFHSLEPVKGRGNAGASASASASAPIPIPATIVAPAAGATFPAPTFTAPRPPTPKDTVLKPPKKKLLERSLKRAAIDCDNDNVPFVYNNMGTSMMASTSMMAGTSMMGSSTSTSTSTCHNNSVIVEPVMEPIQPPPPTLAEMRLQEQLDFEFAKRLHEELNNPRTRAYMTLKSSVQTRSKRQVTLDELIPSKKFKI